MDASADGVVHWRSISRDNILTVYGLDPNSRIADPRKSAHVFSWLICAAMTTRATRSSTTTSRRMTATSIWPSPPSENRSRTANRYLKRIRYGNRDPVLLDPPRPGFRAPHLPRRSREARTGCSASCSTMARGITEAAAARGQVFARRRRARHGWPTRADPFSTFRSGFEVRTYRLCRRALMFHHFPATAGRRRRAGEVDFVRLPGGAFGSFLEHVVQAGTPANRTGDI